jgi:hypothetical protein
MKKYLPFVLAFCISCQLNKKSKISIIECDKFKRGTFFHRAQEDPTLYKIERSDSIQTEFIGKTGDFVNLKISWTGPCSYELTFLSQHILGIDSVPDSYKNMRVKVEIISIRNDSCFVMADNGKKKMPGVVYLDKK